MNPLLEIKNLSIDFISERATTQAVKNISFTVERGEIVAIVGESGSGKTVTALSILQLIPSPPVRYSSGQILFSENGRSVENLLEKKHKHLQSIRGNKISIIFQEPMTSLNPVFTCGHQVVESIKAHKKISASKARREALEWFLKVKLPEPRKIFNRYPHQLSGGQKQRVMIAMAICCHPSLLICDEPTTALDVTVQNAILQLIRDLQREQNMGVIFITHDLGVVGEVADKTIAMYKGEIVEKNSVREIFTHPQHPYTKALLACRPVNHLRGERLPVVSDFLSSAPTRIDHSVPGEKELTNVQLPARENHQQDVLLHVKNLSVRFSSKKNLFGKSIEFVRAVNNVSFQVYKGETLGLVGESG
ncbi:MAG TPA: ABC transporter ATP-binding protein, partial [Chitinophagaceae bacterium]